MKEYKIEVDVTATAYITVEAESEEEAKLLAYSEADDKEVKELKVWEVSSKIHSEKFVWKLADIEKLEKVLGDNDGWGLDEDDINDAIDNNDIVFIGRDCYEAYNWFLKDEQLINNLKENGIDPTMNWFMNEVDKGYHKSGCIEIARLVTTTNGVFYDKNYV